MVDVIEGNCKSFTVDFGLNNSYVSLMESNVLGVSDGQ